MDRNGMVVVVIHERAHVLPVSIPGDFSSYSPGAAFCQFPGAGHEDSSKETHGFYCVNQTACIEVDTPKKYVIHATETFP
jgi:hypothetical protein